jgi:hypothetical protein
MLYFMWYDFWHSQKCGIFWGVQKRPPKSGTFFGGGGKNPPQKIFDPSQKKDPPRTGGISRPSPGPGPGLGRPSSGGVLPPLSDPREVRPPPKKGVQNRPPKEGVNFTPPFSGVNPPILGDGMKRLAAARRRNTSLRPLRYLACSSSFALSGSALRSTVFFAYYDTVQQRLVELDYVQ